ncbi:helix-turn-helix domain-containing protein [Streptomyces sp. NPDC127051]|uniref:helix-turn-helix domain-containing protein n=1 Tax=Streptomyces sp. NPDC127051 TaxID=3347119 RepID=UPI00365267B4
MSRVPNAQLRTLMEAAGWSPAQLARALRVVAAEHGLSLASDHTAVRRWLDGTRPRPPVPALLLECLARRLGRPVTAHEAGFTDAPAAVIDPSWQADPVHKLIQLTHAALGLTHPVPFDARVLSLAALSLPEQFTPAGCPPHRPQSRPEVPSPGPTEADRIRGMAVLFHSAAEEYGGQHVGTALAAYVAHQVTPLLYAHIREPLHRDLLSAAAELTLLLATMCADSGHDRTAQPRQL